MDDFYYEPVLGLDQSTLIEFWVLRNAIKMLGGNFSPGIWRERAGVINWKDGLNLAHFF